MNTDPKCPNCKAEAQNKGRVRCKWCGLKLRIKPARTREGFVRCSDRFGDMERRVDRQQEAVKQLRLQKALIECRIRDESRLLAGLKRQLRAAMSPNDGTHPLRAGHAQSQHSNL